MLGYTHDNNDIFVFFENDELSRLREEKIQGNHIHASHPDVIGDLETVVDEELCKKKMELIVTTIQKYQNGAISSMIVSIMQRVYDDLIKRGKYQLHEGYRHINFLDADRLNFSDKFLYNNLRTKL